MEAMESIPRHYFLDSAFAEQAYTDKAFSIGNGQTISQPYTVAYQTELLEVKRGTKVLEIGTGSGYQASILCQLGAEVYTIERIAELADSASHILAHLNCHANLFVGDGTLGLPNHAPYDRILVTAAAPEIPFPLLYQLAVGGWLIIPLGNLDLQTMVKITRLGENDFTREDFEEFRFVPLKGEAGW